MGIEHEANRRVFWAALLRSAPMWEGVTSLLNIAMHCGARGYTRIEVNCMATDAARNVTVREFLKASESPNDVLVMLDDDHKHPQDVVTHLAEMDLPVVGTLAFRRGGSYDPLMFVRVTGGGLATLARWDDGAIVQCAMVSPCAVAIKRWVFDQLNEAGHKQPYFRYEYFDTTRASEDMWFGKVCEQAGIPHYCDTRVESPHLMTTVIDAAQWRAFIAANPDRVLEVS